MRVLASVLIAAGLVFAIAAPSFAHGDKPHPKCKKGYILNDAHKCVKRKGSSAHFGAMQLSGWRQCGCPLTRPALFA